MSRLSVLEEQGTTTSSCNYCGAPGETSVSHGMWAHRLTCDDYQALVDRGYRRSGHYLYRPEAQKTCCPSYTIRLEAAAFAPSREHRRLQRRVSAFLSGEVELSALARDAEDGAVDTDQERAPGSHARTQLSAAQVEALRRSGARDSAAATKATGLDPLLQQSLTDAVTAVVRTCIEQRMLPEEGSYPPAKVVLPAERLRARLPAGTVLTCAAAHALAAAAAHAQGDGAAQAGPAAVRLAERLAALLSSPGAMPAMPAGMRVHAVAGHLNFSVAACEGWGGVDSPQPPPPPPTGGAKRRGHKEPRRDGDARPPPCGAPSSAPAPAAPTQVPRAPPRAAARALEVRTTPSSFDALELQLYRKYQALVHGDDPRELTAAAYTRFLVDSPLVHEPPSTCGLVGSRPTPDCGFGSFHQTYWLGERLVAVGVVDVLPRCLSSKYLFYDPELAPLCLGKFSALQEIAWVAHQQARCPSLTSYYLGFYIHSIRKMAYKAAFKPSSLLCPHTFQWVPFAQAGPRLDAGARASLSAEGAPAAEEAGDADACLVLFPDAGVVTPFREVRAAHALSEQALAALHAALAHWRAGVGARVAERAACVCWRALRTGAA